MLLNCNQCLGQSVINEKLNDMVNILRITRRLYAALTAIFSGLIFNINKFPRLEKFYRHINRIQIMLINKFLKYLQTCTLFASQSWCRLNETCPVSVAFNCFNYDRLSVNLKLISLQALLTNKWNDLWNELIRINLES